MPQLGIGGCAPIPKKLKPASSKIAEAKLEAAITITGPSTLGNICLLMIRKLLKPNALPASTYCISRNEKIWPRTSLATSTHIVRPTAINTWVNPFPNARVIAITSNKVGIDQTTLIIHMITRSTFPRKNPANDPRRMPIIREMITAINPTDNETLEATIIRLKRSRP